MADKKAPHSLQEQTADQIRNEQRGGANSPIDPERGLSPEGNPGGISAGANATMRRVWSQPGGEANNYRNATVTAGTKADNQGELTAAETPEATKHLSDASLSPEDKDATGEAIERATSANGNEDAGRKRG